MIRGFCEHCKHCDPPDYICTIAVDGVCPLMESQEDEDEIEEEVDDESN